MSEKPRPMTLHDIVSQYLQLALVHPEKAPKTQRAQRENDMLIIGYNRAQETLRTILENHGADESTRALAEVRSDKQERPIAGPGGMKMWVAA